jgi:hypothetical protein
MLQQPFSKWATEKQRRINSGEIPGLFAPTPIRQPGDTPDFVEARSGKSQEEKQAEIDEMLKEWAV